MGRCDSALDGVHARSDCRGGSLRATACAVASGVSKGDSERHGSVEALFVEDLDA